MKKILFPYYLLFIFIILSVFPSMGANYPKRFNKQVNDYAGILKPEDKKVITDTIKDLKNKKDIDLTLLTIDTISTYEEVTIENLAANIFQNWRIGEKEKGRGILVLFALNDRKIRIHMGPAYGNTRDQDMQIILDRTINSFFKNELYSPGLKSLINDVAKTSSDAGLTLGKNQVNISKEKALWYMAICLVIVFYIFATISYVKDNKQGWGYWAIFYTGVVLIALITLAITVLFSGGKGRYHNRHYGGGFFSGSTGGGSWSGGGSSGGGFSGGGATGSW